MAGHYESIGVRYTREELGPLIEQACAVVQPRNHRDGGATWIWRDPSGASIVVRADAAGELACAAPSFDAESRIAVGAAAPVENPDCRFCSPVFVEVLRDGEMVFPLAAELENVEQLLDGELDHDQGLLAMTAFGEEVQAWNDETSFEEAPGIEDLAVESFIPTGTFTDEGELPEARAVLTGIVERARTLRNEATGRPFIHAMVSTYEMTIDCVFAPQDVPMSLSPGSVVQGSFWLMGRLLPA